MRHVFLVSLLAFSVWVGITPAAGCPPGGAPPPVGAAQRQVANLDGGAGPSTLWVGQFRDGERPQQSGGRRQHRERGQLRLADLVGKPNAVDLLGYSCRE